MFHQDFGQKSSQLFIHIHTCIKGFSAGFQWHHHISPYLGVIAKKLPLVSPQIWVSIWSPSCHKGTSPVGATKESDTGCLTLKCSKLALTDTQIEIFDLISLIECLGGYNIWVLSTSSQKSNIGWPQQPPIEKVLNINLIFHECIKILFFQNIKIKLNSRPWMVLES